MNNQLREDIKKAGKAVERVEEQLKRFENGFPYLPIDRPATIGDGLIQLSDESINEFIAFFESQAHDYGMVKFVPASGAASRMFKRLYAFLEEDESVAEQDEFLKTFFTNIHQFAFSQVLDEQMQTEGSGIDVAVEKKQYHSIVRALLLEDGLNYGNLPKGLLDFHDYKNGIKTPVAEHFTEAENYARGKEGKVRLHFTISKEHQELFKEHAKLVRKGFNDFDIGFSMQKPETDTIAVNADNTPFYNEDGSLLFRPAGHGALIENLNDLDQDIVFIKNIDNVVPDHLKQNTIHYKEALAGLLMSVQNKLFGYQNQLERSITELELLEVENFAKKDLFLVFKSDYDQLDFTEKVGYLQYLLHRPIRVCGMVRNTGEPGGGPYWVSRNDGSMSLQIAETSQVDPNDPKAQEAMQKATHFNPVDLVCGIKDRHGRTFDLSNYSNPNTGFISEKSIDGKEIKVLEAPGLWNGAMADWITLFVEVPLSTFNPVKTVNDLLREEHQA